MFLYKIKIYVYLRFWTIDGAKYREEKWKELAECLNAIGGLWRMVPSGGNIGVIWGMTYFNCRILKIVVRYFGRML